MSEKYVRRSEIDRRSNTTPTDEEQNYKGHVRRSGEERRKWIDRMQENQDRQSKKRR